jgi:superfamily II DNA or RNA helicase
MVPTWYLLGRPPGLIAESVDIPSVDAIVFAGPTRSVICCVQALGRALRLDVSGKTASLIGLLQVLTVALQPPGAGSSSCGPDGL